MVMIKKIIDDECVKIYDELGCRWFGLLHESEYLEMGRSNEQVRTIKINSVKMQLTHHDKVVDIYKRLNNAIGGKNIL